LALSFDCGATLANGIPCEPVFESGFFGAVDILPMFINEENKIFFLE
jgi:hypothetical protein